MSEHREPRGDDVCLRHGCRKLRRRHYGTGFDRAPSDGDWVPCPGFLDPRTIGPIAATALPVLTRRDNLVRYLQDKVDTGDWHAVSDAANDLRELEVEIRMTK